MIHDPILEPLWDGQHVLAHVDAARQEEGRTWLRLIDVEGDEVTASVPEVVDELRSAVLAIDCVMDGYLTDQATRTGEGAAMTLRADISPMQAVLPRAPELDIEAQADGLGDGPIAFVAVDLLRLDGQPLLDLPLLERKRLLEGALLPGALVRISPYTRPPLNVWLASWKSAGFAGAVMKAANSRYRPQTVTDEWAILTRLGR
ncbi:MAG: hypothetical protein H0X16_02540 [Chloroflexi bacterium]|nr:hypothetical protein [Chloroflexota bacterium]